MIVYHKKNSYFIPDEDAHLIPMGSYVLKGNEMIYVDNLNEMVPPVNDEEEVKVSSEEGKIEVPLKEEITEVEGEF